MDSGLNDRVLKFCHECEGKQKSGLLKVVNNALKQESLLADLIKAVETGYCKSNQCNKDLELLYSDLFNIYQGGLPQEHLFVLQFIPSLLCTYFVSEQKTTKLNIGKVEAILLAVYNKDVIAQKETPFAKSFRIPSLSKSSVYHEPFNWRASLLTENALSRHEQSDKPVLTTGPSKVLARIPAGYRFQVLNTVLQEYNSKISAMCELSHVAFCKLSTRMALSGYSSSGLSSLSGDPIIDFEEVAKLESLPRLALNGAVVKTLLDGLYFLMHNGLANYAKQALDCLRIHSQTLLNIQGCMVAYGLCDIVEASVYNHQKDDSAFVTNPFTCRRRSEGQSLPKGRHGSRPSGSSFIKETNEYIVTETPKRDELQINRALTKAVSDTDLRMPRLVSQVGEEPSTKNKLDHEKNMQVSVTNYPDANRRVQITVTSDDVNSPWAPDLVINTHMTESSTDRADSNSFEMDFQSVTIKDKDVSVVATTVIINQSKEHIDEDGIVNHDDENGINYDTRI